ncbi:nuclease [Patescibacteria group bacterium]|nr:MAG: nuclease [Patescibacteria group bacterium]
MPRRYIKKLLIAVALVGLSALGAGVTQTGDLRLPDPERTPPGYHRVVEVSDGDTFKVKIAGVTETVRLIGIDTPETKDPRKPVQCFGRAASDEAKHLLKGKLVRLEGDPESGDRDKYQRLLRFAYLEDGTFYNQHMVEQGFAFAYTIFPNSKLELFRSWERQAREAKRGLWAGCPVSESNDKRQTGNE